MRLGIIGLPNCGKTTLFNALTGGNFETGAVSSGQFEVNTAVVNVPDNRLDTLAEMYSTKKTVYATVTYTDIGGLDKGIGEGGLQGQLRNELSQVDGFVHVVRAFESDVVPHPAGSVDPQRDLETLDMEFLLSDLVATEKRIEKLKSEIGLKGKRVDKAFLDELPLMERIKEHLDTEQPLRDMGLTEEEKKAVRGFGFFSLKPVMIVLNMGDTIVEVEKTLTYEHENAQMIGLQSALEAEIAQLDAEDAEMFMEEYSITELSSAKVIRLSYELLNIHSFFTAGEKEVHAWSILVGANAWEAAGAIHGDIQKGFIRAEVIPYNDLVELGSEKEVKSAGKMRLESKEYIVEDGDIIVFRHSS